MNPRTHKYLLYWKVDARHRLDEVIRSPVRFSMVAALAGVENADFAAVRHAIDISGSVLSRQAATLEDAGYVRIPKGYVGKRPRTWLSLTSAGRAAFEAHVSALRDIAAGVALQD